MEYTDQKFSDQNSLPSFGHSLFEDCHFEGLDFKAINLSHSKFLNCSFKNCDLSNVILSNARLRDSSFKECKLIGIKWGLLDDLTAPKFDTCILSYGNLSGLKLKKDQFLKCVLQEVDFAMSDLSECNFEGSDFLNARFDETNLTKANFRQAINYQIDPVRNKVKGAKFSMPEAMGLLTGLGVVIEP